MNIQTKIGLRIKEIRNALNLTQEAVAFKAERERTFVNHVENVSIETLEKVLSMNYFYFIY
jgi:transcriptional regulator with XRE-family HTH domain